MFRRCAVSRAKKAGRGKSAMENRRDGLMEEILEHKEFLKGSLVRTRTRCGRPNCRCAKGQRHEVWHLSYKEKGQTKRVYIPEDLAGEVRTWIGNRKKVQERLDKVAKLNVQLVKEKKEKK
jgi:hypothetical protein